MCEAHRALYVRYIRTHHYYPRAPALFGERLEKKILAKFHENRLRMRYKF